MISLLQKRKAIQELGFKNGRKVMKNLKNLTKKRMKIFFDNKLLFLPF
jgi:hypothetical protein